MTESDIYKDVLLVIDHLIIGPVKLEKKRLLMPYTVIRADKQESKDLIYKYEEDVFEPESPESHNLASLIGAQLALNYGLFCRKITFDGPFDQTDKRFLRNMMENTSREILVNKLYKSNPFLEGKVSELPVEKRKKYTLAEVEFMHSREESKNLKWTYWHTDRNKHCVLSSGGKDSLLSYALLREAGKEVYPIFGNESGRHWFTALNGYRFLKETEPNTGRVWMNSDRLFSWMLHHLTFVRKDFANLRADDYPIRLWTVAVFLFGVLPLMKKYGMGRLIIGDEYDSTQRMHYEGIPHYNGYYDQSRFFDEAMSRFFLKKGWAISQFSVLRPLSELLIMKTLVERYPEIQQHQVSCHAAHEQEGRIYPCGKCEKCRRIVGMLTALNADPRPCGYTEAQIQVALEGLANKKVKQLGPDASHLFYLLHSKKGIPPETRPRPEIMHLRFDRERSHIDGIPRDLRAPLYALMLQHADGAVHRENQRWAPFDLLSDSGLNIPYPFEPETGAAGSTFRQHAEKSRKPVHLWAQLSWPEAEQRLRETDTALLPVGAIEQHGPHLPLDVDAFDAGFLAEKVAEACSNPRPLVLPLIPYGVSYHHDDFPGTISISNEAMARYIYDIGISVARQGIKKLVIINGHGDNAPTLNYAAQMINRDTGIFVCVDTGETSDSDIEPLASTPNDIHAGEIETSTTLAVRPELVNMDKARNSTLKFSNRYLNFSSRNHVPWYVHTKMISETGTMGDPTKASVEKGKKIWEIMIGHLVAFVEIIKGMELEEIFQKRY
jgi:creatinine amidohydrolase/Fe(II)-dependent formamide hydrolase-like protein/7-cyano-7-deazaguanine synthase in queuosine biosynthesis